MHAFTRNPECGNWVIYIYIEPLFFVWQTGASSGFVNLWLVIRWRKLYQTAYTPHLPTCQPLRDPRIGADIGYLLQGIVHSLCRRGTGLLLQSRERNSMSCEVLIVGLKRIQIFLDVNAEPTGKSFLIFRRRVLPPYLQPGSPRANFLVFLTLKTNNTSSRTAM